MATNEWAAGYLEALVESSALVAPGAGAVVAAQSKGDDGPSFNAADMRGQSSIALRYFVNEITGFSEEQLHRTWMKATVMKDVGDRGARLENFCWRIWHLSRRKRQLKLEAASRLEQRKKEQQEVEDDLRQELVEGLEPSARALEWEDAEGEGEESRRGREGPEAAAAGLPGAAEYEDIAGAPKARLEDGAEEASGAPREGGDHRPLYIVMISMHGLVRGENMELGRDSDTGGQVKYVVEYAQALATAPSVYRVDLLTRQILDPEVDYSYGEPLEMLRIPEGEIALGESAGAYIVRLPCGDPHKYLRKEALWPHIPEFVDRAVGHITRMSKILMDEVGSEHQVWPYFIHGHYADAGDAAALLSGALNVPMVLTGHSLGRNKLEQLLKQGHMSMAEIVAQYSILRRIEGEELALDAAELVVTSTRQEVDDQWGLYDGFDVRLERVLRLRQRKGLTCHGRFFPRMAVLPPGMDFSTVVVPSIGEEDATPASRSTAAEAPALEPPIWAEIRRFLSNPAKPMILALARPDPKKNLAALLRAYGSSPQLRELANLTLIMGNRDDINEMPAGNADVLMTVLKLIDKYDLYGLVAYPKHHRQSDVSHIYALAARSKGVFVNPALVEPFGLTLIEAAARGLPMVATKNGGPVDIQKMLNNGILVDPHDEKAIGAALLELVSDRQRWLACQRSALDNIHKYSWPQHCSRLLSRIRLCPGRMRRPSWQAQGVFDALSSAAGAVPYSTLTDSISSLNDLCLRMSLDTPPNVPFSALSAASLAWGRGSFTAESGAAWQSMMQSQMSQEQEQHHHLSGGHSTVPSGSSGRTEGDEPEALGANRAVSSSAYFHNSGAPVGASSGASSDAAIAAALAAAAAEQGRGSMRIRKRRRLIVVAVDEYDAAGQPGAALGAVLKTILAQVQKHQQDDQSGGVGVAVATALTARELLAYLRTEGVPLALIDVAITSSGSAVFYSIPVLEAGTGSDGGVAADARPKGAPPEKALLPVLEDGKGWQLVPDPDYFVHIEFRWSADAVRRSMPRVLASPAALSAQPSGSDAWGIPKATSVNLEAPGAPTQGLPDSSSAGEREFKGSGPGSALHALVEDTLHTTPRCLAYRVLHPEKMHSLSLLRRRLRLRGLRLHLVYCRAAASLLVLPLHASRAQALRYLSVRWGLDLGNTSIVIIHSPRNDSDAPELLSGAHTTFLLRGPEVQPGLSAARVQLLDTQCSLESLAEIPSVQVLEADSSWPETVLSGTGNRKS